jgi:hypothetical protein
MTDFSMMMTFLLYSTVCLTSNKALQTDSRAIVGALSAFFI